MTRVETHEITVLDRGVHCVGCETRIQRVLARMRGIQDVKADHKTQEIRLSLDPDIVSIQEVKDQLEDLGYRTK